MGCRRSHTADDAAGFPACPARWSQLPPAGEASPHRRLHLSGTGLATVLVRLRGVPVRLQERDGFKLKPALGYLLGSLVDEEILAVDGLTVRRTGECAGPAARARLVLRERNRPGANRKGTAPAAILTSRVDLIIVESGAEDDEVDGAPVPIIVIPQAAFEGSETVTHWL